MLNRIKKLCDQNNISIPTLQKELGFSKNAINRWDTNMPSVDKAQKVADYFGVTLDYLTGRTDDPYGSTDLTDEEQKVFDALMKGRASKNPAIKAMAEALSKVLNIDE